MPSYNFIPVPARPATDPEVLEALPTGHGRHLEDRYSAILPIRIRTCTPLLLVDQHRGRQVPVTDVSGSRGVDRQVRADLTVLPVALGPDGHPLLRGSAVKGMLRSAYEVVTNSRFGVLEDHDRELTFRTATQEALDLLPAFVVDNAGGRRCLWVVRSFGHTAHRHLDRTSKRPSPAVWVNQDDLAQMLVPGVRARADRSDALDGNPCWLGFS